MLNIRRQLNAKLRTTPELEKISGLVFDHHTANVTSVFLGSEDDEHLFESMSMSNDIEARDSPCVVDSSRRRSHSSSVTATA
jgi:hypothetical protein